jgi:hypothetical protein
MKQKFELITQLDVSYLNSANRTIETISINNEKVLYLYNHQGQYYKLFDQKKELTNYLNGLPYQILCELYSEEEVDIFINNFK